ncbi:Uncharacterised protein [Actinobacillus equuli]|nr:Uncharacterised protein [Actinobacillus equuli]
MLIYSKLLPSGVSTLISSSTSLPINARATGESIEIQFLAGSNSSQPTIRYCLVSPCSFSSSTQAPKTLFLLVSDDNPRFVTLLNVWIKNELGGQFHVNDVYHKYIRHSRCDHLKPPLLKPLVLLSDAHLSIKFKLLI